MHAFAEFLWRCILRKQLRKGLAIILGVISVAILLAEATLLPRGVDLSLFSILIKSVGKQEVLVQVRLQSQKPLFESSYALCILIVKQFLFSNFFGD